MVYCFVLAMAGGIGADGSVEVEAGTGFAGKGECELSMAVVMPWLGCGGGGACAGEVVGLLLSRLREESKSSGSSSIRDMMMMWECKNVRQVCNNCFGKL